MKRSHMNALLVEIMMAVLFFALSAMVILELFAGGHGLSRDAEILGAAANHAQCISEQIYAADDPAAALAAAGFIREETGWRAACEDYTLLVTAETAAAAAGEMHRAEITAVRGEEVLVTLPFARYIPGEAAQ